MRAMADDSLGIVPAYTVSRTRLSVAFSQDVPIERRALVHGELSGASVARRMLTGACAPTDTEATIVSAMAS